MSGLTIEWISHNRKAKCPPNPDFPNGMTVDIAGDGPSCQVSLPYPAEECGVWVIRCPVCGYSLGVTAAGRVDDTTSVRIPCKLAGST